MTNGREMMPPPGFSTPPQIPNNNTSERPPVTTTVFTATTPEKTPFVYHASTSANPNPIISPAFDYDEEREMEPRPNPHREATPTLRPRSPVIRRQQERVVGFEDALNREGSRRVRNAEGQVPVTLQSAKENYKDTLGGSQYQAKRRTRSLVEHLSTDLPSTYKGLMEETYIWIEAREVATNGTPNYQRENFERLKRSSWDNNRGQKGKDRFSPYRGPNHGLLSNLSKSPREILATEKAAKSFEQPPRMFGSRMSQDMSKYCHFHEDHGHETNDFRQLKNQIEEAVKSGQLSHLVKGTKKERVKASETSEQKGRKLKAPHQLKHLYS
ncbi:hypothetical protein Tco_0884745 [Tanacetum coccineum]